MIIDLSGILKDIGGVVKICEKADLQNTEFLGEEFVFTDGLLVDGKIANNTKSLHLSADVSGKMQVHCARCMCEIEEIVEFKISEYLVREEDAAQVSEDDDAVIFSGEKIDIDELILNNFLMNVSGKYLCSEDCKGLCPNCGKNLNLGECDCSDNEIDPRWAALAEIMKNSETE